MSNPNFSSTPELGVEQRGPVPVQSVLPHWIARPS